MFSGVKTTCYWRNFRFSEFVSHFRPFSDDSFTICKKFSRPLPLHCWDGPLTRLTYVLREESFKFPPKVFKYAVQNCTTTTSWMFETWLVKVNGFVMNLKFLLENKIKSVFDLSQKCFPTAYRMPGLSSHRYSVIFSADSEIFAFSAMFRAEPADFNFDISGHNWFSDEHFWTSLIQRWTLLTSSKQAKTMKKAKKIVFFSILMLKRREIGNFRKTFTRLIWKILKMWFFRNLYSFLNPCQKTSY